MFRPMPRSEFAEDCFLAEGPLRVTVRRRSHPEGHQRVQVRVLFELTEELPVRSSETRDQALELAQNRLRDCGRQLLAHRARLEAAAN